MQGVMRFTTAYSRIGVHRRLTTRVIFRGGVSVRRKSIAASLIAGVTIILSAVIVSPATPITYRFRLEAEFTFDGQLYTAIGYMRCTYQKAPIEGSDPYRLGGPIYQGYYTTTWRDTPSVVLPNEKGAIVIRHTGGCPPLSVLKNEILNKLGQDA